MRRRRVRKRMVGTRRRNSRGMWIPPGEFSCEKAPRSKGKESKHRVETRRTHVVPAFRVSIPVWNDDERGRMGSVTYVTRCVVVHHV